MSAHAAPQRAEQPEDRIAAHYAAKARRVTRSDTSHSGYRLSAATGRDQSQHHIDQREDDQPVVALVQSWITPPTQEPNPAPKPLPIEIVPKIVPTRSPAENVHRRRRDERTARADHAAEEMTKAVSSQKFG